MAQLTRHQMGTGLLAELRQAGLGIRDLFEGRQEPLSWFFRAVALDQSELDILESGAVEQLHVPTALVELAVDEMALGLANIEIDGLTSYLVRDPASAGASDEEVTRPGDIFFDPSVMMGFLNIDVVPPPLWLEERDSDPATNERLASSLTAMAQEVGEAADAMEVHIEGAIDPESGWEGIDGGIRPAGVSVHFSFDIPLLGTGERELSQIFGRGASVAAAALEQIRLVFRVG